MSQNKNLLVLGRRDHAEAMRVAAGLTIFGHAVRLIFMTKEVEETEDNAAQVELLQLADITPQTTVPNTELQHVNDAELAAALMEADAVINI